MGFELEVTEGESFERPLVPSGLQQVVLTQIVDLGTHHKNFKGDEKDIREVRLMFLTPKHTMMNKDEAGVEVAEPLALFATVTLSLNTKSKMFDYFTSMLGKALPKEFNIGQMLGVNAMANVIHRESNGKTYANISSLAPLMDGMTPVVISDLKSLDLDDFDKVVYDSLGKKTQEKIANSPEGKKALSEDVQGVYQDETPF
jgi:hypothetical protein